MGPICDWALPLNYFLPPLPQPFFLSFLFLIQGTAAIASNTGRDIKLAGGAIIRARRIRAPSRRGFPSMVRYRWRRRRPAVNAREGIASASELRVFVFFLMEKSGFNLSPLHFLVSAV